MTLPKEGWFSSHRKTDDGVPAGGVSTGFGFTIAWQDGALGVSVRRNGAFLLEVLGACYERLDHYQSGQFACDENAEALKHLDLAIESLRQRRNRREKAGTLGTHNPD